MPAVQYNFERTSSVVSFTVQANGDIEHNGEDANDMTMNPIYRSQPSYDKMEFPRHDLGAIRSLGNGSYGRAFLARASGIRDGEKETMVVVKALSSNDDQVREEFNKEMEALCGLQHENVVTLLGVCKEDEPLYMIFESMEKVCVIDFYYFWQIFDFPSFLSSRACKQEV